MFSVRRVQIRQCRDTISMWKEPNKQEITVNGLSLTYKSFGIREATQRKKAWWKIRGIGIRVVDSRILWGSRC